MNPRLTWLLRTASDFRWLLWFLLFPGIGQACNVPVFRYALERWQADRYEVVVFQPESLSPEQPALIKALEKGADKETINLTLELIRLQESPSEAMSSLWKTQTNAVLPWMVLRYPQRQGIRHLAWSGPLNMNNISRLLDSPARQEIAKHITSGVSAVWLLLEGGDRNRDEASARLLEDASRQLEKSLALPPRAPDDPPIRSSLPVKIAFQTVRLARANPAEQIFLELLFNLDPEFATTRDPVVFAAFGRGRILPPLAGEAITIAALRAQAEFLTGACSCQAKMMNPGFDLLLAADWPSLFEGLAPLPDPPLLTGLSQAAGSLANPPADNTPKTLAKTSPVPESPASSPMERNLLLVFGAGFLAIILGTVWLKVQSGKIP